MKLMIAVPCMDFVPVQFVQCLTALTKRLQEIGANYDLRFTSQTLIYRARDALCTEAVNGGYTHILFLDSDVIFPPDLLETLLETRRAFVSGIYYARRPPFLPCVFSKLRESEPVEWVEEYPDNPFEIEGCGFGCVLIDHHILKHLRLSYGENCFTPIPGLSEDLTFCLRARKAGYHIICQPKAKLGHIGHLAVWPDSVPELRKAWPVFSESEKVP